RRRPARPPDPCRSAEGRPRGSERRIPGRQGRGRAHPLLRAFQRGAFLGRHPGRPRQDRQPRHRARRGGRGDRQLRRGDHQRLGLGQHAGSDGRARGRDREPAGCTEVKRLPALILVLSLGAQAAEPTACTLEAWSTGTTLAERRIHAGPGADTPVITTMPAPIEFAGFTFRVTLTITEVRDGWFRVSLAMADNPILDALPSIVFKGDGWVSGDHLGLVLNHVHLYAEPSGEAAVVAKLAALDEDGVLW